MNSGGLRGCPLSTNTNAGAGDKTPNYVCNPTLFIDFVIARNSFQMYSNCLIFKAVKWNYLKDIPGKYCPE